MKVLLLSCGTGEGHNSAGKAVMEALIERGAECEFFDPIALKSEKAKEKVSGTYNGVIRHVPMLFGIIYMLGKLYSASPLPSPVMWANSKYADELAAYIKEKGFDAVVSPHIFTMQAMLAVRKKHNINIPVYCIMTDYTVIPFFVDGKELDYHYAPNEKLKRKLMKMGFEEEKIHPVGIPVSPKFNLDITKKEARAALGLDASKKLVMIMTGGAGCGNIKKICKKLLKKADDSVVIYVFCGRNEKLYKKITEYFPPERVRAVGFTDKIYMYMKAADVVLSKAGGLSSTEVAVANVPFVHLKAIPGCESYNIKYFTKNRLSLLGNTASRAAKRTVELLENPELCEEIKKNQKELIPSNASSVIADMVLKGKE